MLRKKLFNGVSDDLTFYNAKPIINYQIEFFVADDCETFEDDETDYTFSNFVSAYFRVYNERGGKLIKTFAMTLSGSSLVLTTNDTTFEDLGNYHYEICYMITGGYELALMYGTLRVI